MIVVDASVAVSACLARAGFAPFVEPLVAPPLMWSESRSALHELVWRGLLTGDQGEIVRSALDDAPVERYEHSGLSARAWEIADALGWTQTYDAEYVALADLLGCRLVTIDSRWLRGAARLGFVVSPVDL